MYTKGELVYDYTSHGVYSREILDPDGDVICYVIETKHDMDGDSPADALLSHLNRGQ